MKTVLHVLMAIWALIYAFSTYLFFANEFNNVAFIEMHIPERYKYAPHSVLLQAFKSLVPKVGEGIEENLLGNSALFVKGFCTFCGKKKKEQPTGVEVGARFLGKCREKLICGIRVASRLNVVTDNAVKLILKSKLTNIFRKRTHEVLRIIGERASVKHQIHKRKIHIYLRTLLPGADIYRKGNALASQIILMHLLY